MIRLRHVRNASDAAAWLKTRQQNTDADALPPLVMCVTEGHDALRQACAGVGHDGDAFFLDAATPGDHDGPVVVGPDLVRVPEPDALVGALPFLARVQESEQALDILWVEDSETPNCDWLVARVDPKEIVA